MGANDRTSKEYSPREVVESRQVGFEKRDEQTGGLDGYESYIEMRVYLDTNILIFFLLQPDDLEERISNILLDYSNILLTSTVCVNEFIHLCQIGKINYKRNKNNILAKDILTIIEDAGIGIIPTSKNHLRQVATLPLYENHRDPNDRLIIVQAVSDRIPLISSDHKFTLYTSDGLDFIFNKR